jgi:hypothetical protein
VAAGVIVERRSAPGRRYQLERFRAHAVDDDVNDAFLRAHVHCLSITGCS